MTENNIAMPEINYNSNFKDLIDKYPELWHQQDVSEGHTLISLGSIPTQNIFLETAVVMAYYEHIVNGKTKKVVLGFFAPGEPLLSYNSFLPKIPRKLLRCDVVVSGTIRIIEDEDWNKIEKKEPKLLELLYKEKDKLVRKFVDFCIIKSTKCALERYEIFMQRPYAQHLKICYIASFIDILPNSLSRLRNEKVNGKNNSKNNTKNITK